MKPNGNLILAQNNSIQQISNPNPNKHFQPQQITNKCTQPIKLKTLAQRRDDLISTRLSYFPFSYKLI